MKQMSSNIAKLKQRVLDAEAERDFYRSLVEAFFSGDVPDGAVPEHFILARWGRKRHEDKRTTAALLQTD